MSERTVDEARRALNRINLTLETLREIDPTMPIQTAHVLTLIAANPGITMQKLCEATGLSQSSCSRNVAALSQWHRTKKGGYDLVERVEDPADRRIKRMFLTAKGRDRILAVLRRGSPDIQAADLDVPTAQSYEMAVRDRYRARGP